MKYLYLFFVILSLCCGTLTHAGTIDEMLVTEKSISDLENLTNVVMKRLEEKHNIDFHDEKPILQIQIGQNWRNAAEYDASTRTITINGIYTQCDISVLQNNLDAEEFNYPLCPYKALRQSLSHELGHFYTHVILDREVKDSWLAEQFTGTVYLDLFVFTERMIIEGIGESFGDSFGDRTQARVGDVAWTLYSREEMDEQVAIGWFLDQGGHHIVRPILESQGYAEGVRWILNNSVYVPLIELRHEDLIDWSNVLSYQQRGIKVGIASITASR